MSILRKIALVTAVLLVVPVSSYAIVDLGVYGGYTFSGEITYEDISKDTTGYEYGVLGHLNGSVIPMVLSVGIGGFYQRAPLEYEADGKNVETTKTAYGLDGIIMLELPILIHPYVRGGVAIKEKLETKIGAIEYSESSSFDSYYFGIGGALTIFPMVQLFGEYMYNTSKQEDDVELKSNSVHVGARLNI
jgi:hypothetical protein